MATEKPTKKTSSKDDTSTSSPKKRKAELEELEVDLTAPEPPSKRAKRALKKGKSLPPKPDSDDDKPSKSRPKKQSTDNTDDLLDEDKEKEKAAAGPVRSEHAVWIGNLPFTATVNELRAWLVSKSGGAVSEESITRVHLPTQKLPGKKDKANKGFAYVDFADLSAKLAAITLSEEWLGIRKLLIKDHKSFDGRPKKEERAAAAAAAAAVVDDTPASRKIFVGNLGFQTTEDDVRNNFEKCGEIDWVKTATFEDSGKCKGYGWVKFREAESAAWAVKGFVKIKEEIETEDDFVAPVKEEEEEASGNESSSSSSGSDSDSDSDGDGEEKKKKKKEKKTKTTKKAAPPQPEKRFKTRKWWVNRIAGRTLKIELAEDDQTRYKKRYKGGPKKQQAAGATQDAETGEEAFQRRKNGGAAPASAAEPAPKPAKELKTQDDLLVARLTGAAAKSTGTKIKF